MHDYCLIKDDRVLVVFTAHDAYHAKEQAAKLLQEMGVSEALLFASKDGSLDTARIMRAEGH